ncbi:response regulator [Elusimicrobiota bacterium]
MKKTYTTFNISKILDVYPTTVAKWIDEGKLKAFTTPGGHRRVSRNDLIGFLGEYNIPVPEELLEKRNKRVLIVDDDEDIQKTIITGFNIHTSGYDVKAVSDGFEAGHELHDFKPDIVLLDILLPGIDGLSVCKLIRTQSKSIKIVVITSFPSAELENKLLQMGADAYLPKPFSIKELLDKIEMLLI